MKIKSLKQKILLSVSLALAGLTHQCLYFEQPHTFEQILFIQTAEPAFAVNSSMGLRRTIPGAAICTITPPVMTITPDE